MQDDINDDIFDEGYIEDDADATDDAEAFYREEDAKRMVMHTREISVRLAIDFCKTPTVNTYHVGELLAVAGSIYNFINKTD